MSGEVQGVPVCGKCGRWPIDHRGGVCLYPRSLNTGELTEMVDLIHFKVGEWQDFGYANPPTPECKTIPALGDRSAGAIKAGHAAIEEIDKLTRKLYEVREALVGEFRWDSDIRGARVDAMLARLRQERQS